MVSPLFLYCCYLYVGEQALHSEKGTLCIVAESWAVLESLAESASRAGWSVRWMTRKSRIGQGVRFLLETGKRLGVFVGTSLLLRVLGDRPSSTGNGTHVLLSTFVDASCFAEDGVFRDRYFPGLCQWLEEQGYMVSTIPVLFNRDRSYRAAWKWLRTSNQKFLNPYLYYRAADYGFAISQAWRQLAMPEGTSLLAQLDVTRLFTEARQLHGWDVGSLQAMLSHRLPLRLAESDIRVDLFISNFENMIPEKPLILGFRRYLPDTRLVGFQHGALPANVLCLYVTEGEAKFAPLPDRIVCNGGFFREILVQEGLPADRAIAGPALRYRHLWREPLDPDVVTREGIFAPLPAIESDAVELVMKLIEAFSAEPQVPIWLKPHPMLSFGRILDGVGVSGVPEHFHIVSGEIEVWLARARVVIALSSGALYEALAAGIPVVPVGREVALDLNPLVWLSGFERQYCSAIEILTEAMRLMRLSSAELRAYQLRGRQILEESFGRVDDSTLRCFVDGLLPTSE
jgi:hypothetical protein